ncbi:alpha/beta hydrolase, putative [Plasmodium malariae]|nr:alpha/beta hydrolase, putative [Plasmodium malariae]SBT87335.1 alpha/beta hydrolase, putative [Plasmodium malariae]
MIKINEQEKKNTFMLFPSDENGKDLENKNITSLLNEITTTEKEDHHDKKKKKEKKLKEKDVNFSEKIEIIERENHEEEKLEVCDSKKKVRRKYLTALKCIISSRDDGKSYPVCSCNDEIGPLDHSCSNENNTIISSTISINERMCSRDEGGRKSEKSRRKEKWSLKHRIIQRYKKKSSCFNDDQDDAHENEKEKYHTKERKEGEQLEGEERTNEEEKFITYKVPRYLRKKNIKCPFVYRKVFYGKYGIVNYDLKGRSKGTLVITFHGLNGTNLTFLEIQKMLIKYKFQVLNFDLYGHGLSACPKYNHRKRTYGIDFFLSQTEELLNHLKLLHKDFYLIGFSMGCVIATSFAKKYIKQVKKIILISPVGVLEKKPFVLKILKMFPFLINISSFFMLPCFIKKKRFKNRGSKYNNFKNSTLKNNDSKNNDITNSDSSDYLYNRIMWQVFVKKNITHSILGCINNLKMWSAHDIFKEVGLNHLPVLILCGEKDNICNVHVFKNTSKFFNNCHLIIFKNASHLVLVEKMQEINSCVLTFFRFPNNADLKSFHHMFPVDKVGNSVLYEKANLF